ncbi:hypothetical protein BJX64DRAFT_289858 [Aspergillus heterothallicus]
MSTYVSVGQMPVRSFSELPHQFRAVRSVNPNESYRGWAFVGQIAGFAASGQYDTTLLVRDAETHVFPLGIKLNQDDESQILLEDIIKIGCTIIVLNACKTDMRARNKVEGIVIRDIHRIKVLPFSFKFTVALYRRVRNSTVVLNGKRICYGCLSRRRGLHACPLCRFAFFCDRDCQTISINEGGHGRDCKILRDPDLAAILRVNYLERFESVRIIIT